MVKLLPVAAGVLGFESEGEVVFLVGLQFVSRQLQLLLSYAMNTKTYIYIPLSEAIYVLSVSG